MTTSLVPKIGAVGTLAQLSTDASGNTVLVGADGVPFDRFPLPLNPNGLDWLTDTQHGFDMYERGFVKRPTIFFDPTATSSMNRGTFKHPYNTQAALQAVVSGDMRGHTLGMQRAAMLQPTGTNGLSLTCYGTESDPFTICPYGDAEALPIISAHSVPTWTLVSGNIWQTAMTTQHDVWQSEQRITNKTWNTDAATTLTADGTATWNSNVMYIRPYDGENPNLGQVFTSACDAAMLLRYSDVAGGTGHIEIAGIDMRYSRKSVLDIGAEGVSNIDAAGGIKVVGCRISKAGVDASTTYGDDALVVYGPSDAVRLSDVLIAGNECFDALNNAIEVAGMNGCTIEHNYGHDCGGNMVELWSSNSNVTVRYNYGKTFSVHGRVYTSFSGGGIWFTNYYNSAPGTWDTNDATNAKNSTNKATFNLFEDVGRTCADVRGGTGHVISHNTWIIDHDALYGATAGKSNLPAGLYTNGTAATGFCDWSNNIIYYKPAPLCPETYLNVSFVSIIGGLGATNSVPTGDNNVYFVGTGYNVSNWKHTFVGISDTAQAGAATTITLAAGSSASTDYYKGGTVTITGGTGAGQTKSITAYNGSTKVATVSTWTTAPDVTSTYTITGTASRTKLLDGTNAAWQYDLAQASIALDQNSLAAKDGTTYGNVGGTLTTALVGMDFDTATPLAANIAGATSLTGIGTRYKDGQPYVAASCNSGALLGT